MREYGKWENSHLPKCPDVSSWSPSNSAWGGNSATILCGKKDNSWTWVFSRVRANSACLPVLLPRHSLCLLLLCFSGCPLLHAHSLLPSSSSELSGTTPKPHGAQPMVGEGRFGGRPKGFRKRMNGTVHAGQFFVLKRAKIRAKWAEMKKNIRIICDRSLSTRRIPPYPGKSEITLIFVAMPKLYDR